MGDVPGRVSPRVLKADGNVVALFEGIYLVEPDGMPTSIRLSNLCGFDAPAVNDQPVAAIDSQLNDALGRTRPGIRLDLALNGRLVDGHREKTLKRIDIVTTAAAGSTFVLVLGDHLAAPAFDRRQGRG